MMGNTGWFPVMGPQTSEAMNLTGVTVITAEPWDGLCQVCNERPGTEEVHGCPGGLTHECRQCIVESMLKGAREQAARIPELEKELEQLTTKGTP